jgi:Flp pilus assembly protein TadB
MNRTLTARFVAAFAVALSAGLIATAPAQAQTNSKRTPASAASVKKKATAKKATARKTPVRRSKSSTMSQAEAYRKLKDYNYVKSMSPYAGSPNKWGPKW